MQRDGAADTRPSKSFSLPSNLPIQMIRPTPVTLPLIALALSTLSGPASAQQTPEGPILKVGATEIAIGGRVHTQFNTTTADGSPATEWLLRRVRLEATVRVNDVVSGKVQPDFAGNRVSVKDAYLKLDFSPAVQVIAGKAFRPFSLLEQTSSNRILPIERGLAIRGVEGLDQYSLINDLEYSDRQTGFQVLGAPPGAPLGLTYAAGVFQSPIQEAAGTRNPQQYAARATVSPAEALRIGLGWSYRDFATGPAEEGVLPRLAGGNAFEADLEWGSFRPGPHLLAEVAWGDYDPFTDTRFLGAQGWFAYRTGAVSSAVAHLEPVLRVSYGDLRDGPALAPELGGTLLTPGINVYLGGQNRAMFNYDLWFPGGDGDTEGSFKARFQLAF